MWGIISNCRPLVAAGGMLNYVWEQHQEQTGPQTSMLHTTDFSRHKENISFESDKNYKPIYHKIRTLIKRGPLGFIIMEVECKTIKRMKAGLCQCHVILIKIVA